MLSQHSVPKHRRQLLPLAHESLAARFSLSHCGCTPHATAWYGPCTLIYTSQTPAPSPQCGGSAAQCVHVHSQPPRQPAPCSSAAGPYCLKQSVSGGACLHFLSCISRHLAAPTTGSSDNHKPHTQQQQAAHQPWCAAPSQAVNLQQSRPHGLQLQGGRSKGLWATAQPPTHTPSALGLPSSPAVLTHPHIVPHTSKGLVGCVAQQAKGTRNRVCGSMNIPLSR